MIAAAAPTRRAIEAQGLRLNVVEWGRREAAPVFLIHGGLDHARTWDWLAQSLTDRFHVIAPDLRGHGDSDWAAGSSYATLEFLGDLERVTATMASAPAVMIGHSFGASLALIFAALYPERIARLVLIEGTLLFSPPQAALRARIRGWLEARAAPRPHRPIATIEQAALRILAAKPFLGSGEARVLAEQSVRPHAEGGYVWKFDPAFRAVVAAQDDHPGRLPAEEALTLCAGLSVPVLHLSGTRSFCPDPAAVGLTAALPDARWLRFEEAGHWCHLEHPDESRDSISRFLADKI